MSDESPGLSSVCGSTPGTVGGGSPIGSPSIAALRAAEAPEDVPLKD
eukprot:gene51933-54562_t